MIDRLITFLRFHATTQGLSEDDLRTLANRGSVVEVPKGSCLAQTGEIPDALYLIVQGRLKLISAAVNGQEQIIKYFGPGDQFGTLALVLDQSVPCDLVADVPSLVLSLRREVALELTEQFPILRRNMLRSLGAHVKTSLVDKRIKPMHRLVSWIYFCPEGRVVVANTAERLATAGEQLVVLSDQPNEFRGSSQSVDSLSLLDEWGAYPDARELRDLVEKSGDRDRIFVAVDGIAAAAKLKVLVALTNHDFWLANSRTKARAEAALEQARDDTKAGRDKTSLVWVLPPQQQVACVNGSVSQLVPRIFKVEIANEPGVPSRRQRHGVERIVHYLRDVRLGLALGGGAARGMAHLGVLQTFEKAGIFFDVIAGTSAGSLTGIPYAAGYEVDYCIERFTADLQPSRMFQVMPKGDSWYLLSKYRTNAWRKMLRKYLHDWNLEQLPLPFCAVAVDLISAKQVIRESGDAVSALVESINLPILSPPICRDGMALVDGGLLNVLPADVLVNRGCNFVVAVNVSAKITQEFYGNHPETPTQQMKTPTIGQTYLRQMTVQNKIMNAVGTRPADFVIAPDVSRYELTDFVKTPEIAAVGSSAAAAALPHILEMLGKVDAGLFGGSH